MYPFIYLLVYSEHCALTYFNFPLLFQDVGFGDRFWSFVSHQHDWFLTTGSKQGMRQLNHLERRALQINTPALPSLKCGRAFRIGKCSRRAPAATCWKRAPPQLSSGRQPAGPEPSQLGWSSRRFAACSSPCKFQEAVISAASRGTPWREWVIKPAAGSWRIWRINGLLPFKDREGGVGVVRRPTWPSQEAWRSLERPTPREL